MGPSSHPTFRCPHCNVESPPVARYCHSCGRELQPRCQACGTVNPAGSNFCFSCGNRLVPEEGTSAAGSPDLASAAVSSAPVCPRCYKRNEPGSAYCFACGMPLNGDSAFIDVRDKRLAAFALGRPAGFWVRLLAYLIDGILLTLAFALVWPIVSGGAFADYWQSSEVIGAGDVFSLVFDLAYYTFAVGIWSTTIGKRPFRQIGRAHV